MNGMGESDHFDTLGAREVVRAMAHGWSSILPWQKRLYRSLIGLDLRRRISP